MSKSIEYFFLIAFAVAVLLGLGIIIHNAIKIRGIANILKRKEKANDKDKEAQSFSEPSSTSQDQTSFFRSTTLVNKN